MPTFFQPADLPVRCLLREVLYWIAFQRLPMFETDHEGVDVRESIETGSGYVIDVGLDFLDPDECKRANIPVDPDYLAAVEGEANLGEEYYRALLEKTDSADTEVRARLETELELAKRADVDYAVWKSLFLEAIEYPKSQIFVASFQVGHQTERQLQTHWLPAHSGQRVLRERGISAAAVAHLAI